MAVIRQYTSATAKRPRVIGALPMPDGSTRRFKGHTVAEVTRKWESAWDAMQVTLARKAASNHKFAEYSRKRREFLAAHGICQRCGQQDAEPGRTLCWACRLYHNQSRSGARTAPRSAYGSGRRAG